MNYLLDTNVLSELVAAQPNENVVRWISEIPNEALYVSVLTLGEIRKGVEKSSEGKRKQKLKQWLEHELPAWFEERVLPIDHAVADKWGYLHGQIKHPLPVIDSLLAATALHHDLCLVTRNIRDFQRFPLEVLNPWLM
jgi:toxin FitB